MNELREAALDYAQRGWRVFPVHGVLRGRCTCGRGDCPSPGKHPLVRRGVREATTDPRMVGEWWRRWRGANIGLATGAESRIAVIDVDLPTALDSLSTVITRGLPRTFTALTGGGGIHLVYRCTDGGLGNSAGCLPGIESELPGIDLRANGGYIVAPPSVHRSGGSYEWLDAEVQIASLPRWLKQPERSSVDLGEVASVDFDGHGTAYGRAALDGALTSLRTAPVGQRNHTLNRVAFAMAQLIAGGELLESAARSALMSGAFQIGLTEHESRLTIESGFEAGSRRLRSAPHRQRS